MTVYSMQNALWMCIYIYILYNYCVCVYRYAARFESMLFVSTRKRKCDILAYTYRVLLLYVYILIQLVYTRSSAMVDLCRHEWYKLYRIYVCIILYTYTDVWECILYGVRFTRVRKRVCVHILYIIGVHFILQSIAELQT